MNSAHPENRAVTLENPEKTSFFGSVLREWNQFWFTPGDPTLLGLIRLCTGLIALYTILAYTIDLQDFHGTNAWYTLEDRHKSIQESPVFVPPFHAPMGNPRAAVPASEEQKRYMEEYQSKFNSLPPGPFPTKPGEPLSIDPDKAREIDAFREHWGVDPRDPYAAYARGTPEWSIWMHVTEPATMMAVHWVFVFVTFLFMIGFCTRLTSVLAWFAAMNYVLRSPLTLFGVDTMMLILMIYLMLGPSGAAVSVDRWIAAWWKQHGRDWLRRWGLFGAAPAEDETEPQPTGQLQLEPLRKTVVANVALRMLQIHVCIIYAAAGLAKLKGSSWWSGTAIWGTLANPEFAPLSSGLYMYLLQWLANNFFFLQIFLFCGTIFTLFFEICYPFLIWSRRTRWLMLSMAIVLHGLIGMIMGLKTFALVMLVMNMAFLPPAAVQWILSRFQMLWPQTGPGKDNGGERPVQKLPEPTPALHRSKSRVAVASPHLKGKK
jgi:hypothetical protein